MLCRVAFVAAIAVGALAAPPTMPQQYSAVIQLNMPYIPLSAPLKVSTSASSQKLEWFDGLEVDTTTATGSYKFTFNNSKRVCLFAPASAGPTVELKAPAFTPAAFLPDLSHYKEEKNEVLNGILCRKFTFDAKQGKTGTMDDHMVFYWDAVMDKPVRWHMHARAIPFGSHTDEYILDFIYFQAGIPPAADLVLPSMCTEDPTAGNMNIQVRNFLEAARAVRSPSTHFETFLQESGKSYSPEEHVVRKSIFEKNMRLVDELNQQHAGKATFTANRFMDMTKEEIMSFRGGKNKGSSRSERRTVEQQKYARVHETSAAGAVPKDFDWRTAQPGVVGPVKDQAFCGSCWTYGVTEPIESAIAIKAKKTVTTLPEQFVLDCTWTNGIGSSGENSGCDGGDSDIGALEIVRKYGGVIPTAAAYGNYLSINGYCKDINLMAVGAKITGWVDVKARDEKGLMQALVEHGPQSVGIQVPDDMLYYDSGVFDSIKCKNNADDIDHAVVMVGYGTEAGKDYYLIRNSWSTYWGDRGYIKIARGDNDCCVSCQAGYPEVAEVGVAESGSVIV